MNLLLEIGLEEIPAAHLASGMKELERVTRTALGEARLWEDGLRIFGAPRRLAFLAEGIKAKQDDLIVTVKGPSCQVGVNGWGKTDGGGLPPADGARLGDLPAPLGPAKAAEGFARGQGVAPAELVIGETPSGFYLFANKKEAGQEARQVLPGLLVQLVEDMDFPRTMRWGEGSFRFIRPIRWVVALLEGEELPLEVAGRQAGRESRGQRTLHPAAVSLAHAGDYQETLRGAWVLAEREERRCRVAEGVEAAAATVGGRAKLLPGLLDEVCDLVEYPTAFAGSFSREFLALPEAVLVTTIRVHQRYFPVEGQDGKLLPFFVAVRNGGEAGLDTVRVGNEKVLRARLADAVFFYQEDRKRSLADRVEDLRGILFQERLGSMYEKTGRLERLSRSIGEALAPILVDGEKVARIARLAKTDLLTNVVRELPELQGIMGREYARLEGEAPDVAEGIFQHLLPRNPEDDLPEGAGMVVALADKLDTVVGGFLAGLSASGSEDPYGLRRQGAAVVRILAEKDLFLSLEDLGREALEGYLGEPRPGASFTVAKAEAEKKLGEFFYGRVRGFLHEAGYGPEIVEAVLGAGFVRPADVRRRAEAVKTMVEGGDLATVLVPWRRAASLAGEGSLEVEPSLLEDEAERQLLAAILEGEKIAAQLLPKAAYAEYCGRLREMGPVLDRFFRVVMVMVEMQRVRENRLALLRRVAALFAPVAKWSALFPLVEGN